MTRPILLRFDDQAGALVPSNLFQERVLREQVRPGAVVPMIRHEQRSQASHAHYFASVRDGWSNLPEALQAMPWAKSAEHLRKYALIKAGFCDVRSVACGSRAAAERVAVLAGDLDEFCLAHVEGSTCTVFTAQSQSMRAMGKARFQESKDAVLGVIEGMLGVDAGALAKQQAA